MTEVLGAAEKYFNDLKNGWMKDDMPIESTCST